MHPEPEHKEPNVSDSPKFGRLLIILVAAVLLIALITVASEAYYS
ncbi:hypothetical protein EDC30_102146 [Paucimonas lemoignei]|uniref:Uncharacterized protein n=1 Tax=Paucimonas lemoignei TaxID=29443 RepID=A0A4R3HYV3_PAULE|nr:hypothetical protein [Paucimonas lemoignei]TCS38408.1 hypothetical protein EDC30_102146 [Paucimonas lemoignei]